MREIDIIPQGHSTHKIVRSIYDQLKVELDKEEQSEIVIPASLGIAFQDMYEFKHVQVAPAFQGLNDEPIKYKIGSLNGCDVIIDPNMQMMDTRIITEKFTARVKIELVDLI